MSVDFFPPLFDPTQEARAPWSAPAWTAALVLAGIGVWGYFLSWGSVGFDYHDWADINVPRLLFLQHAISGGDLPLHMASTAALHGVTDRFFSLPDVVTTPQTLLLAFISVPSFIVLDVLLHYAAGAWGLLVLRRRLQWSLFTFTVVFLLVLFNGHVMAHYSVGHFTWASYFLLPLVFVLLFRFLDGEEGWGWVGRMAALLFYMLLAGGWHHVVWVLMLLTMLVPFCWPRKRWLLLAGAASVLLGAVRLLPPALELQAFANAGITTYVLGYPSTFDLLRSFVDVRRDQLVSLDARPGLLVFFDLNYWEFDFYVGAVGAAAIAVYGVYGWLKDQPPRYQGLIVPSMAFVLLSMNIVFRFVRLLPVPLLQGERVSARMLSVPVLLFMIMAGVGIQRRLDDSPLRGWLRWAAVGALALLAIDLSTNVLVWRVAESARLMGAGRLDATAGAIAYRDDPPYVLVLGLGLALTVATATALGLLARHERRRPAQPSGGSG